jgi:ribosomal protein S18 acetylase RimI-like enzyme
LLKPAPPLTYHLRQAKPDDAGALQAACWTEWPPEVVREVLVRVDSLAVGRRGHGVVAANGDGQVFAFGQLSLWPRAAEISDLIVTPDFRGHGIGSAMIRYLVGLARAWGVSTVEIGVAASNPRALALYRRLGFHDARTLAIDTVNGRETVIYLHMALQPAPSAQQGHQP